jgi:hypothetical protein
MENHKCTVCKGEGKLFHKGFTTVDGGTVYPDKWYSCHACDGIGTFPALTPESVKEICDSLIVTRKGVKSFRKSAPKWETRKGPMGKRIYYVWRLVRFHSGKDVTLPMTAEGLMHGDCERDNLDDMARLIASKLTGKRCSIGAVRWRNAMGYDDEVESGLPPSAYSGGPEHDEDKPAMEILESGRISPSDENPEQLELRLFSNPPRENETVDSYNNRTFAESEED